MASSVFAKRRAELLQRIGEDAVAIFASPPETLRNGDVHNPFRQSSDLYYLTGFTEPETVCVLRPGAEKERFILFVRPRDKERETWEGRRAGPEGATRDYGADAAFPIEELSKKLPELLANAGDLYYSLGLDPAFDARIAQLIARLRMGERRLGRPPRRVVDPRTVLHEMRLIKSPEEVAILERAAAITTEAHVAAMKAATPGTHEYEIEALINYTFRRRGGAGPGYGTIVAAGENATILHYTENDRALQKGDLVLIDAGAEVDFYTADVTRTFPCGGSFSRVQRDVYDRVLAAQEEAIAMTRPGATIDAIHERVVELLTQAMIDLELLSGDVKERIADESYKKYYMHRTSHWLGMDVHDVGAYLDDEGKSRPLEPGNVITIEPGLYVPPDDETAPEALRGLGIRIEDDILVTPDGRRNLTAEVPKRAEDIERVMAR